MKEKQHYFQLSGYSGHVLLNEYILLDVQTLMISETTAAVKKRALIVFILLYTYSHSCFCLPSK